MKRTWGVVALASFAIACGEPAEHGAQTQPNTVTTTFDAEYRAASDELGVPYELLRGMGFAQTAHHHVSREASHSGQAGVMGLPPASVAEGARLLGVSEADVANDARQNVRAAAAIILDRRLRGETWNGAALEAAGMSGEMRARWLQKYAKHLASVGELVPQEPSMVGSAVAAAGEYPPSTFVAANSGNYTNASRGVADVNYVVIHDVEGSYEGCISWFQNPSANVSAHYVVSNEGNITQMVWEADIAWHAGNWNYNEQSVGIEHEGYASDPDSYPETMLAASAGLTRYLTEKYSIPRTRNYVIAHAEVPNATHTDPGPYWEWDHYMELVDETAAVTAKLVGYVREGDIYEGAPIEGATVTLDGERTTTTDAAGYYEFDALQVGLYTVTATKEGYETATDEKEIETASGSWWKSLAMVRSESTNGDDDDDDDDDTTGGRGANGGGGVGCSVTDVPRSMSVAPFALFALAIVAIRRRS